VSLEVLDAIDALEPSREALFEAQTAAGMIRWNESLLIDLRFAGGGRGETLRAGVGRQQQGAGLAWGSVRSSCCVVPCRRPAPAAPAPRPPNAPPTFLSPKGIVKAWAAGASWADIMAPACHTL
jgi:hypothetical protein